MRDPVRTGKEGFPRTEGCNNVASIPTPLASAKLVRRRGSSPQRLEFLLGRSRNFGRRPEPQTVHWLTIMQRSLSRLACVFVSAVATVSWLQIGSIAKAQSQAAAARSNSSARHSSAGGLGAVRAYDAAVRQGPIALHAFLVQFPKGADLHVHLSGAIYAETFIRDAAEDGLCVDPAALKFAKPPCADPLLPAARLNGVLAPADQDLYDRLINSFSMRSFVPSAGFSGHDQFFGTFARYGGIDKRHTGEGVYEVASRAAAQNQQ